jgi:hypothetical protein
MYLSNPGNCKKYYITFKLSINKLNKNNIENDLEGTIPLCHIGGLLNLFIWPAWPARGLYYKTFYGSNLRIFIIS